MFDGVAMIDPEGRKKYLVARDETNRCVCSNGLSSAFVRADAPVELTGDAQRAAARRDAGRPDRPPLRDAP